MTSEQAQDSDGDPFYWDPQRLAEELCSPHQPWFPKIARRFPDLQFLSKALKEHEVDGEAFLIWDSVASMQELFSVIGVTHAHHSIQLRRAIITLQERSPAYSQWKAEEAKVSAGARETASPSVEPKLPTTASPPPPPQTSQANLAPSLDAGPNTTAGDDIANGDDGASLEQQIAKEATASNHPVTKDVGPGSEHKSVVQPPNKKRRLAPVAISSDVVIRQGPFHVPTEADGIEERHRRPQRKLQSSHPSGSDTAAYMGPAAIRYEDILSISPGIESSVSPFESFGRSHPPGHTLRVNRAIRALLSGNKRLISSMVETFDDTTAIDPDSLLANLAGTGAGEDGDFGLPGSDEIIGPFGDGSDDEIDPQTAREMEQERADIEREARRHKLLTREDVDEEIDDAIVSLVSEWQERKLPTLERKAYRIWTQARDGRSAREKRRHSIDFLNRLKDRIAKQREEILNNSWTSPQSVRRQARCLEQSIFDREYHSWRVKVLDGGKPPKPVSIPRPPKQKHNRRLDEDDEVLTSDTDDSMGDFIVEDDDRGVERQDYDDEMLDVDDVFTTRTARSNIVKPDPSPEPLSDLRGRNVIDLTADTPESEPWTESDHIPEPEQSGSEDYPEKEHSQEPGRFAQKADSGDESEAAESGNEPDPEDSDGDAGPTPRTAKYNLPVSFWQSIPDDVTVSDYDKRLVNRLWRIEEATRNKVYDAAKDCEENASSFWELHVVPGLDPNTPMEDTSTMIARLFLYYAHPDTSFHANVFNKVRRKNQSKVLDKKDCMDRFLPIILRIIPLFPKVLQLSALAGGEEGGNDQVVLDLSALQLRQRDQRRIAEQDRRREELRESLALYESIPKDASRLIINETKEEDEGLIYIRGEPARLIKDHQVDGVRFLWNRIIANPDVVRHGCVLAHSMGLGKSMQVITFLLAVAHASRSLDESIRSQIPKDLRESRTLILCPANLSQNWRDEFLTWDSEQELGHVYLVASAQKNMAFSQNKILREGDVRKWTKEGGVLILGYELFVSFTTNEGALADIIADKAVIVVADEAHTIKNPFSKRRRACSKVTTPARIALTGSPLANNVTEYYSMVDWVAPKYMGSLEEFTEVYATPIQKGLYKEADAHTKRTAYVRLSVLRESMAPKVHRCGISILRDELKPKQEFMFFIPLTDVQKALYNAYVKTVATATTSQALGALSNLTLICLHPQCFKQKVDAVLEGGDRTSNPTSDGGSPKEGGVQNGVQSGLPAQATDDVTLSYKVAEEMDQLMSSIAGNVSDIQLSWRFKLLLAILDECRAAGDKVLVFSRRRSTLNFLQQVLGEQGHAAMRLDGQTPMLERLGMIKRFNTDGDPTRVFLISTKAGGVGLNIHGANRVVIMDFAHNPMDEQQAIGRAYRIGQDKPVFVYWFVSWGTHEAKLQSRLVYKKQLADRVVEGKDYRPWAAKDVYNNWVQNVWETSDARPLPPSEAKDLGGVDAVVDRLINDQELSQGIESIVTTDTFEVEEDPDDVKLTAEEHESASLLVQQEAQRRQQETSDSPPLTAAGTVASQPPVAGMSSSLLPPVDPGTAVSPSPIAGMPGNSSQPVAPEVVVSKRLSGGVKELQKPVTQVLPKRPIENPYTAGGPFMPGLPIQVCTHAPDDLN